MPAATLQGASLGWKRGMFCAHHDFLWTSKRHSRLSQKLSFPSSLLPGPLLIHHPELASSLSHEKTSERH